MKLQGPNWDGRRVYTIRNAKIHQHENGRITHITGGEVFLDTEPIAIHHAARVCIEHWTVWNAVEPVEDADPTTYGFDVGDDCTDTCATRWFYDVTDIDPVTVEMPKI